jgi:hypothetical protein
MRPNGARIQHRILASTMWSEGEEPPLLERIGRLAPAGLEVRCSIQLSYGRSDARSATVRTRAY